VTLGDSVSDEEYNTLGVKKQGFDDSKNNKVGIE